MLISSLKREVKGLLSSRGTGHNNGFNVGITAHIHLKALAMLHAIVHMKCCAKNDKRKLEKSRLISLPL